jgi:hypothetical protein
MEKSFKYEFINELEYDFNGDKAIAEYVEIMAPSNRLRLHTTVIECAYMSAAESQQHKLVSAMPEEKLTALMNSAKETKENEINEEKQTPFQIVNNMLANLDAKKMNAVYNALEMILKDTAMIDGNTKFGSALFSKMSFEDTKNLLGEYIDIFFTVSPQV